MAKVRSVYVCQACGYESPRWYGKCPGCDAWNTLEETVPAASPAAGAKPHKQRAGTGAEAQSIARRIEGFFPPVQAGPYNAGF